MRIESSEIGIPENVNPSDYVALVRLDVKSDRREIQISKASTGLMSVKVKSGFPKDNVIPITIEEVTGIENGGGIKVYRVKVVAPIPANEYAFTILGERFFDFGVDTTKRLIELKENFAWIPVGRTWR